MSEILQFPPVAEFTAYSKLFSFFLHEHKLILTNEEMDNVIQAVDSFKIDYSKMFQRKLTISVVSNTICTVRETAIEQVRKPSRKIRMTLTRKLITYYLRRYTEESHYDIATHLGYRDHTSSVSNYDRICDHIEVEDEDTIRAITELDKIFIEAGYELKEINKLK